MQDNQRFVPVALAVTLFTACESSSEPQNQGGLAAASLVAVNKVQATEDASPATPQSPSGTRLRSIYFDGADGSRLHYGFFDSEREERCHFAYASGGQGEPLVYRCFPEVADNRPCDLSASYYQDRDCTVPLYHVWTSVRIPRRDKYVRVSESVWGKGCEGQTHAPGLYKVKRWLKPAALYQKSTLDQSCSEFTAGFQNYRFYEFGERVPEDVFVQAGLTTDVK